MNKLITEMRNNETRHLHTKSISEILQLMNEQDKIVAPIVGKSLAQIEKAIHSMVTAIETGGHIVYLGAGTSGRLGVLDASECPPTFGVEPELFKGIIAGGDTALRTAIENAEDSKELGRKDVNRHVQEKDVVIGIASSGTTPYVIGAMERATELGVKTIGIACNADSELSRYVDIAIEIPVGPELIAGSTRLKAGTAQKMVLNMLSTVTMVKTGKVYDNLMINLQATNEKLRNRSLEIIMEITGVDVKEATIINEKAKDDTRVAILMLLYNIDYNDAKETLMSCNDNFITALSRLGEQNKKQ